MNDPIVDEVRRVRDAHAARFNYDLDAIFQDIKEREKKSGLKFIQGVARQPVPNQAVQPTGAALSVTPDSTSPEAARRPPAEPSPPTEPRYQVSPSDEFPARPPDNDRGAVAQSSGQEVSSDCRPGGDPEQQPRLLSAPRPKICYLKRRA